MPSVTRAWLSRPSRRPNLIDAGRNTSKTLLQRSPGKKFGGNCGAKRVAPGALSARSRGRSARNPPVVRAAPAWTRYRVRHRTDERRSANRRKSISVSAGPWGDSSSSPQPLSICGLLPHSCRGDYRVGGSRPAGSRSLAIAQMNQSSTDAVSHAAAAAARRGATGRSGTIKGAARG